jgi:hypothetical protein
MNTRAYRRTRLANNLELLTSTSRRQINAAARDVAMAAAMLESAALYAAFQRCPAEGWALLAGATKEQRVTQAIDMACYLRDELGIDIPWGCIRERWELKLAEIAAAKLAEAEALAAAEAAKAAADNNDCYDSYIAAQPRARAAAGAHAAARSERERAEGEPFPGDDPLPFEPTPAERAAFLTPGRAAALVGDLVDAPQHLAESRRSLRDAAKALERIAARVEALLPCAEEPGDTNDCIFYAGLPIVDALHGMADLCRRALRAL